MHSNLKSDEELISDIIFEEDRIRDTFLDKYDGVQAEILQVTRFDESTDLSTTYLGKTDVKREYVIKAGGKFPISGQGYTIGKLLDQTECSILIDTGASKSYMSKSYHMRCKSCHALAKFASTTQRVQEGNGQYVVVLFEIPVIVDMVDLVLGMKNVLS